MNARQLKNSILQMAVQGKLAPQDPKDEPASVLLEKIRAEKERLGKAGKIKKEKALTDINEDEVPFEVPGSWEWVRLGDIVTYSMGKTPPRKEYEYWDNVHAWVSIADMVSDGIITDTKEGVSDYAFDKIFRGKKSASGTLIMSFKLTVGKVSLLGIDAFHNEAIISIYPFADVDSIIKNYLFRTLPLLSSSGDTKSAIKGNTLNSDSIDALLIPLPPLAEQRRIVRRIEALLPLVEEYDKKEQALAALDAAFPDQLKKSILQAAVRGKLVPQDPKDEPASVLLEKIRAEKERLIKAGKVKKEKAPQDASVGEDEVPFEVPEGWAWVRLGDVFPIIMGQSPDGNSVSEFGSGVEFHQGKVFFGERVIEKSNQVTTEPTKIAPAASVLLCVRAPVGKVNITDREICIGRGLCAVVPIAGISLEFVFRLLEAYELTFVKQATGTTFVAITGEVVKNQLIPLPPLPEQRRIVSKIDELLGLT